MNRPDAAPGMESYKVDASFRRSLAFLIIVALLLLVMLIFSAPEVDFASSALAEVGRSICIFGGIASAWAYVILTGTERLYAGLHSAVFVVLWNLEAGNEFMGLNAGTAAAGLVLAVLLLLPGSPETKSGWHNVTGLFIHLKSRQALPFTLALAWYVLCLIYRIEGAPDPAGFSAALARGLAVVSLFTLCLVAATPCIKWMGQIGGTR